jgi:hypothetical protein
MTGFLKDWHGKMPFPFDATPMCQALEMPEKTHFYFDTRDIIEF